MGEHDNIIGFESSFALDGNFCRNSYKVQCPEAVHRWV